MHLNLAPFRLLTTALALGLLPLAIETILTPAISLAQTITVAERDTEADRLKQAGIRLHYQGQSTQALVPLQQALEQYRTSDLPEPERRIGEAETLTAIAEAYLWLNRYQDAADLCQQALEIYREYSDPSGEAHTWLILAVTDTHLTTYDVALEHNQQALRLAEAANDSVEQGIALIQIGSVYVQQGDNATGQEYLQKARSILEQPTSSPDTELSRRYYWALSLSWTANSYLNSGDFNRALNYVQQALTISREIGSRSVEQDALFLTGNIYQNQSEPALALEQFQQALAVVQEIENRQAEGNLLNRIGVVYYQQEDYEAALNYFQQAVQIQREVNNQLEAAQALVNVGTAYQDLEQFPLALQAYRQALQIYRELEDRSNEAETLFKLGKLYSNLENYSQALEAYQQALDIFRSLDEFASAGNTLYWMGEVYFDTEQYPQALEHYQQALTVFRQTEDEVERLAGENLILGSIGLVYRHQGQTQQALEFTQQALLATQELIRRGVNVEANRNGEAVHLLTIGQLQGNLGQYDAALDSYQRSLAIYREMQNREYEMQLLGNIGALHRNQSQYDQAIAAYQQLLIITRELKNTDQEITALLGIGDSYNYQSEYALGLDFYQQALQIAKDSQNMDKQATALGRIASVYTEQGNYTQALQVYQQVLVIEQSLEDGDSDLGKQSEGQALRNIGVAYQNLAQYDRALEYLQQALAIFRDLQDSLLAANGLLLEGDMLNSIGIIYTNQGRNAEAMELFQQALAIAQKTNQPGSQYYILNNIGLIYAEQGEYAQALNFYQQALATAQEIRDRSSEATALNNIASVYSQQGQYADALALYRQALTIRQEIGDRAGEASSLNNLASSLRDEGEYLQELELLQQALVIAQDVGDPVLQATLISNLGVNAFSRGDYPESIQFYQQALAIAREVGNRDSVGNQLHGLGVVYSYQGEFAKSDEAYNQALAIARELGNRSFEAVISVNLGKNYYYQAQYAEALDAYQQGLAIFQELGERPKQINLFINLGEFYTAIGQYPQALEMYQQGLTIAQEIGAKPLEGNLLSRIGEVYENQGQSQQALQSYQQALRLQQEIGQRSEESQTLRRLGSFYSDQSNATESISTLQQSLQIAEEIGATLIAIQAQNSLARVYLSENQTELAFSLLQQAAITSRAIGDRAGEAVALSYLGELLVQQGQPETAIVFYKQSINVTESIRRNLKTLSLDQQKSYTETIADIYRALVELLLEQGRILEAQQVLELLKVEELREFTRGRVLNTDTREIELTPLENDIWQEFGGLIALGQQIDTCEQAGTSCDQLYDQRKELTHAFDDAVTSFTDEIRGRFGQDPAALNPEDFVGEANDIVETPGTILIYPVVLEDKLWVLWATAGGVVNSIEVPVTRQQLGEAVLCFRQLMSSPDAHSCDRGEADIQAAAQELYRYLIPPQLEQEFAQHEIQNLVFSLDRVTRYIPIAALHDGEHYLIQRYTISTILSAGLTRHDNPLPQSVDSTSVLALGLSEAVPENASEETPEFIALTHVPDELNAIGQIYPGEELLNQQFSDRAFYQLNNYQVLHIATHGVFVPARQDRSYLILGTKQPLRIRQIEDIQQFFSNLSLVVLSACETALGDTDQDGIEINGIAHSFIQSGANTVIASLWQVNDGSTSLLMRHFYNNLAQSTPEHPVTISQALRQAQLSLLQGETGSAGGERGIVGIRVNPNAMPQQANDGQSDYSHPYYWAPFILIGNGL